MDFKERLKELRKAKGLSQVALAKKLGLSKSTIGAYEVGDIDPSLDALEKIADFFNVDMAFLLGEEEKSRFFMDYGIYNIASELSNDSDFLAVVERASNDANFRQKLLAIVDLMELEK